VTEATATGDGMPEKISRGRQQEAAANAKQAREKTHRPTYPGKIEYVQREFGDGKVDLHLTNDLNEYKADVASHTAVNRLYPSGVKCPGIHLDRRSRANIGGR